MEILALTGFAFWAFWAVLVAAIGILVLLTENEHWGWATVIFTAFFVSLGIFGIFNLYAFALSNPTVVLMYFGIYLLIGCFWGAVKWWQYCKKQRNLYEEAKADFLRAHKATELTPALRVAWTKKLQTRDRYDRFYVLNAEPPVASNNKEKIMNWMYLWPFSMLGTFMSDFLRKLWVTIYNWMGGIYDSISRAVWSGTENDLASEEDLAAAAEAEKRYNR